MRRHWRDLRERWRSSVSAEIDTDSGLLVVFSLKGFKPGEDVETTSRHKGYSTSTSGKASERGEIPALPVQFEQATKGKKCTVLLRHPIGKDALVAQ
ncbi:MAG: hypothetical protein HP498_09835 [Nitrospira sp.]|nr:hypothetical protein [Nitrospira sp.]